MIDDDMTHTIQITITGNYPHGDKQHASVMLSGQGDLSHFIDAFKAALIAGGYSVEYARLLDEVDWNV